MDFSVTRLALSIIIAANSANMVNLIEQSRVMPDSLPIATVATSLALAGSFGAILFVSVLAQRKYLIRWLEI